MFWGTKKTNVAKGPEFDSESHYKDWPNDAGFHAPIETREPKELAVKGSFPAWASGTLLRTGPGRRKVECDDPRQGEFQVHHWFDGFAHIHKFEVKAPESPNGQSRVFYQSRSHVDAAIEEARKTGKLSNFTFGQKRDPCDSFYKKFKTIFQQPAKQAADHHNISVAFQPLINGEAPKDGRVTEWALTTDQEATKSFDMDTLEPLGIVNQSKLHSDLKGPLSSAHPCMDDDYLYNYNLDLGASATYRVFRTSLKTGETKIIATIADPKIRAAYIHSFFMTKNYVVICIWTAFYSNRGLSILWERNILDAIEKFDPSSKCTWLVIDRQGERGVVSRFESPAMFCFHTVNAWEEQNANSDTDIFCELCTFNDSAIMHGFYYENLVSNGKGVEKFRDGSVDLRIDLARFKLGSIEKAQTQAPIPEAETIFKISSPKAGDLPIINPAMKTKKHRYVYTVIHSGNSSFLDTLGKTDTETHEALTWCDDKCTPSEAIFVADPNGKAEDDGILLSVVLNGATGQSFLLCLNARDMTEMARADCEVAVGLGYHGLHIPSARL